jgi:hypothetical protein
VWLGGLTVAAGGCTSSTWDTAPAAAITQNLLPESSGPYAPAADRSDRVDRADRSGGQAEPAALWPTLKLSSDGPLLDRLRPSNSRPWSPDQAVLPYAEFDGDLVRVHNIRNCAYRTIDDYTACYYQKTLDLGKLSSVDLIAVRSGDAPASVLLSFGFQEKDFLVVSVEARKPKGETYSALRGLFNQYELIYVLADERDVFAKNSLAGSEVCLYRTRATSRQARDLFIDVMRRVNQLVREPEFYNTLTNNCATNVRAHLGRLAGERLPYDWRALAPGDSDRLACDLGLLAGDAPFEQARARARVDYQAYLYRDDPELSQKLRR